MGPDRRTFFAYLAKIGALSGLAAMFPSDAFGKIESSLAEELPGGGMQIQGADGIVRTHFFHANAAMLQSNGERSLAGQLPNKASIKLPEEGGFRSQFIENYRSNNGVSFKSAYVHVAGTRSSKPGYGWVTLATSILTGLNVRDLVTADLVMAQVSTEDPLVDHVPAVSFQGSRIENLRICGRTVDPVFDLDICGPRPNGETPYVREQAFLDRVASQYQRILNTPGLPDSAQQQYHWDPATVEQTGTVKCSLVTGIERSTPGTSFGHIIQVPGLGEVALAELIVDNAFHLTPVNVTLPPSDKWQLGGSTGTNGHHQP